MRRLPRLSYWVIGSPRIETSPGRNPENSVRLSQLLVGINRLYFRQPGTRITEKMKIFVAAVSALN